MTEPIVDLTGMAINELNASALVTAITGALGVHSEFPSNGVPPKVIVRQLDVAYQVGRGTRRLGLQSPLFTALCYAAKRPGAAQLANAVVATLNMRGPRIDAAGRLVYVSLVESGGDVDVDPLRGWPFATVVFRYQGAQQAVAVA